MGIVAVLMTGLGTYILQPMNYMLYTSGQVQNMTAAAKQSADTINGMISFGSMFIVGAIFLSMYATASRTQGGIFS